MRLWQFGRLKDGKIKIESKLGDPLGLTDGSQVFSSMFRYEHSGSTRSEVVLSPFGPDSYRHLCNLTIYMLDLPGACAQASKFLAERNVDILNSVSLSTIPGVAMTWRMLADLSYFGEPEELKPEFDAQKKGKPSSLDKVDALEVTVSRISDRYSKGAVPGSRAVKTKQIKRKDNSAVVIENGEVPLPKEFLEHLGDVDGSPVMLIGDLDSQTLSVTFLEVGTKLAHASLHIPDKPGSVNAAVEALAREQINLIALYTEVLVFGKSMTLELVIDAANTDADAIRSTLGELSRQSNGQFVVESVEPVKL